jgi:hypothetical protein
MIRNTLVLSSLVLAACGGSDPADGTLRATVYGEEFIEDGIPADVFSDGWSVSFDKFLVSIGNVAGQAGHDNPEIGSPGFQIVDLAQSSGGEGYELAKLAAPGGEYDHYGYQLKADPNATALNADPADVTSMKAAGYSIWVKGSATKGAVTKTFDWGFTMKLTYAHCDLMDSVDGDTLTAQATIHADHLFYDDAVSEEPNVAFQLIADADANADNTISSTELAAMDIRSQTRYQVGSKKDPTGATIENLWQFIETQTVTVGHINGEGHCEDQLAQP